jgi:hypothetical protein
MGIKGLDLGERVRRPRTVYRVWCRRADGSLRWFSRFENLVVDEGLSRLLALAFDDVAPPQDWRVGLKGAGTVVASDTLAAHPGWEEIAPYDDAPRPALVAAVAGLSGDNAGNPALFHIDRDFAIPGIMLCDVADPGYLWGAGDFPSGPRPVTAGETLEVVAEVSF